MFDWILSRKLNRIARRADPSHAFIVALEKRFRGGRPTHTTMWKVAMTSMTSAGVLFLGTGTYAYASENVVPDHPLYGVRQTIEQAESALAFTPTLKARVGVHLMSRRLREEEVVAKRRKAITQDQIGRFIRQTEDAMDANRLASSRVATMLDTTIASLEKEHVTFLEQLRAQGVDSVERGRIALWLTDQTEKLQARIRTMPVARQAAYQDLLERKLSTISPSVNTMENADEILKELEAVYADINAQLDAEKTAVSNADDIASKPIDISDITAHSIVEEQ